jgi:hypothetical protein
LTFCLPRVWPVEEMRVVAKPGSQGLFGIPGLQSQTVVSLTFLGVLAAGAAGANERLRASASPTATTTLRSVPLRSSITGQRIPG